MSGHSKWHSIKHQKGITDAKRGNLFTKLSREIIVAVRQGGSNQEANFRLRLAVQKARDSSMPFENIDRAIKRGAGTLEGVTLEEMVLEGYSNGGAAILVQAVSDNHNRTVQEVRNIFSRNGGNLGESGCVAWLFENRGLITAKIDNLDPDEVGLLAIDAGADDVKIEKDFIEIYTRPEQMEKVRSALEAKNIKVVSAEISMMPKTTAELGEKAALQTLKLMDKLEEMDEVQHVSSNADFSDAILEKYQQLDRVG
ncbi:MAG: YebC/PmpR family DNA-binding transcriptional regulator [Chloroflexi bacterium]|nr:YebC/PmpR family DNA-binding transcriptional regulator [Chloroflexota bacterium]